MKLTHRDPFSEFDRMNRVLDRMFSTPSPATSGSFMPIDLFETETTLVIRASVPGLHADDIDVTIEENVLTLSGEHRTVSGLEDAKVYRREISSGKVMRSVRLPDGYDLDNVDAGFENGILTVTLPKLEEELPQTKRISVRSIDSRPTDVETDVVETN